MTRKSILFYSVLAIFLGSALVTLLGLAQVVPVKDEHLSWLLTTLIGQVVVAIIALFKSLNFFDHDMDPNNASPAGFISPRKQVWTPRIGDPPKKATKKEENLLLADLKQWEILEPGAEGNGARELHRIYEFKTFEAAFKFMSTAATRIVSAQDHHPRWENTYNRVEVWLSTFNLENQISNRDLRLARSLEQLWEELGKGI